MGELNDIALTATTRSLAPFADFFREVEQLIETEELVKARDLIFSLLAASSVGALATIGFEASLHAEMYARMQPATDEDARLSTTGGDAPPATLATSHDFARKPFAEAVSEFQKAVPMPPGEFRALEDEHRARGFTMARTANMGVLRDAHAQISQGLIEGTPKRDVIAKLRDSYTSGGVEPPGESYLSLVYDNAVLKSYGQGRWQQMTSPIVLKLRPVWEYVTRHDSKVRAQHRALDGKAFVASAPFWQRWYPPNGHRCRCGVRTLSLAEAQARGLQVEQGEVPKQIEVPGYGVVQMKPEPGWGGSPATAPAVEATAAKVEREIAHAPLLGRDPAGLVRDDAKRAQVVARTSGLTDHELAAQLAATPRFDIYSGHAASAPRAGELHVDWHCFSQNTDGAAQLVTRAVQEPGLFALRDRLEVVSRASFDAALDPLTDPAPELVWNAELAKSLSPPGCTVASSTQVAVRFQARPGELADLLAFLQGNGERRPGATPPTTPVKFAWDVMDAEVAAGAGVALPSDLAAWRPAVRNYKRRPDGREVSVLSRKPIEGWERTEHVLINESLWSKLG